MNIRVKDNNLDTISLNRNIFLNRKIYFWIIIAKECNNEYSSNNNKDITSNINKLPACKKMVDILLTILNRWSWFYEGRSYEYCKN